MPCQHDEIDADHNAYIDICVIQEQMQFFQLVPRNLVTVSSSWEMTGIIWCLRLWSKGSSGSDRKGRLEFNLWSIYWSCLSTDAGALYNTILSYFLVDSTLALRRTGNQMAPHLTWSTSNFWRRFVRFFMAALDSLLHDGTFIKTDVIVKCNINYSPLYW